MPRHRGCTQRPTEAPGTSREAHQGSWAMPKSLQTKLCHLISQIQGLGGGVSKCTQKYLAHAKRPTEAGGPCQKSCRVNSAVLKGTSRHPGHSQRPTEAPGQAKRTNEAAGLCGKAHGEHWHQKRNAGPWMTLKCTSKHQGHTKRPTDEPGSHQKAC